MSHRNFIKFWARLVRKSNNQTSYQDHRGLWKSIHCSVIAFGNRRLLLVNIFTRTIRDQLSDWFRSRVAKHWKTPPLLNYFANCLYFDDKIVLRPPVYVIQILFKIHRLQWCILYCDSENNGTTIFDFLTNRTNVHEARIMYPLPSRYISWWCTIKDLQESQTILQPPNPTSPAPARSFAFDYLVSSDSPTTSTHTCAHSSLAFTFFFVPARMFVSRARNRSDRTGLYSGGGLRTSALEDFIEGFPRSRRRFWTARLRPRRRRRGNEEAAQLVGFEGDDPKERGSVSSCLSEGKKIFIGPMVARRKRRGSSRKWRSGWKVHWRIARDVEGWRDCKVVKERERM